MRVPRLTAHLQQALTATASPAITGVRTFEQAGYDAKPSGVVVDLASGGSVYLQVTRSSPPQGDDFDAEEQIVTGDVLNPVPVPALAAGPVRTQDLRALIIAALINSGSPEIETVAAGTTDYGIAVNFYNGATGFVLLVHTVPAGQQPQAHREFQVLEAI